MQREINFFVVVFNKAYGPFVTDVYACVDRGVKEETEKGHQRVGFSCSVFGLSCCNSVSVLTHRRFCTSLNFTERIAGVHFNHLSLQKD